MFWGMSVCVAIFGYVCFDRYFLDVSFQNIAFGKEFMKKCNIFTIFACKLIVSYKVLYKLKSFIAYFCQHH